MTRRISESELVLMKIILKNGGAAETFWRKENE